MTIGDEDTLILSNGSIAVIECGASNTLFVVLKKYPVPLINVETGCKDLRNTVEVENADHVTIKTMWNDVAIVSLEEWMRLI